MPEIITTGDVGDAERKAERDLGAIINEVDHLGERVVEHTTTLDGLKENWRWITEKIEQVERDAAAIPQVPGELIQSFSETVANLTTRLERLETGSAEHQETKPPERRSDGEENREEKPAEKDRSILDHLF
jgi:uncharacterized coiled-coil protein SlyX